MSGNLSFGDLKSHVEIGEIDTILACIEIGRASCRERV